MAEFERAHGKQIPDFDFRPPDCPICVGELQCDGGFECQRCGISWDTQGESGGWRDYDGAPCERGATLVEYDGGPTHYAQCHMEQGHKGDHAGFDPKQADPFGQPTWLRWNNTGKRVWP